MNTRTMPCTECCTNGGAIFEGDKYMGWTCRNCGHRVSGSKAEMLEILRSYSDSPKTTALQAVVIMDAEIKRLRAALASREEAPATPQAGQAFAALTQGQRDILAVALLHFEAGTGHAMDRQRAFEMRTALKGVQPVERKASEA